MGFNGKQHAAFVLAAMLALISMIQSDETYSAVSCWWRVNHATSSDFVVPHWWTQYTVASALFAPIWIICTCAILLLVRRRPGIALAALSIFLVAEPISCASAPTFDKDSGKILGLEELPFADAERELDMTHLLLIDERIKIRGDDFGKFPLSPESLKDAVGDLAFDISPYEYRGKRLSFDLRFITNDGVPYSTDPEKPGIVYYAVNPSGDQFALTISGLNAPIDNRASMMKQESFVGSKQPWGGLLATEEWLHRK
jgi:hypothetical protein